MFDALNPAPDSPKRAAFLLREPHDLAADLPLILPPLPAPGKELALSGPSAKVDPLHRPVRGDLAHIRCAGTVFVPHYAVPMPHRVADGGACLRKAAGAEAEAIVDLAGGETFNVLDIAGGWAWGQQGEDGFVGYVPMAALVAA